MVKIIQRCRLFGTVLAKRRLARCINRSNIRSTGGYQGSDSASYQGDGKTTVRLVQDGEPNVNFVNTYSSNGFRLSNNLYISGSILLFPTHVYSWNVGKGSDITLEALRVFDLIVPRVKIIVIGYGRHGEPYDSSLPLKLKSKGISCEMLPTKHAITTYNFLVSDAVHVAGAFVPHRDAVKPTEYDHAALNEEREFLKENFNSITPDRSRETFKQIRVYEKLLNEHGKGKERFDT